MNVSDNRFQMAGVKKNASQSATAPTGPAKGRSLSLTAVPPLPAVCITPSPEESTIVGGSGSNQAGSSNAAIETAEKKLTTRQRPRLSIPHIFAHHPSGTLTSTPSISSLFTAAAARNFNFSLPHSMRRGSWSVSLSSSRTNIIAWAARLLPVCHPRTSDCDIDVYPYMMILHHATEWTYSTCAPVSLGL